MKFWAVLDSQGCREENPTFGEFSDLIERIILCVVVADRNNVLNNVIRYYEIFKKAPRYVLLPSR